jgi:hypothetical protein
MNISLADMPYEGTFEELQDVERDISRIRRLMDQLDEELAIYQTHRQAIRRLILQNQRRS